MPKYNFHSPKPKSRKNCGWTLSDDNGKPIAYSFCEESNARAKGFDKKGNAKDSVINLKREIEKYDLEFCIRFTAPNGVRMAVTEWRPLSGGIDKDIANIKNQLKNGEMDF